MSTKKATRRPRTQWSNEMVKTLIELFPDHRSAFVAEKLKVSIETVRHKAYLLKIRKSRKFHQKGLGGRLAKGTRASPDTEFTKGHKPWNTGTKGLCKPNAGCFKKGRRPANELHDGAIVIRRNRKAKARHKKDYKWIRISKGKWKMYHVYVWQQANGPVPEGYIVIFKDGDTMNCDLKNLQMITRQQHMANTRDSDAFIAKTLAAKGRGVYDKDLAEQLLKHPELIETKRMQLSLNLKIKHHEEINKIDDK